MVTVEAAIEFIRKHVKTPQPLFAVVWFGSPHNPHQASEQDRALYANQEKKKQNFYGEITGMDRAMGKLRKELRTLRIHKNTILWYCSDNGGLWKLGVTGGRNQKGSIYEGGLRVPAIIEWPARIPKPRITEVPANTVDIYPTLLQIAGVKPQNQPPLDGHSLIPLIDGQMTARAKPMGFWNYPAKGLPAYSKKWMTELLEAQKKGKQIADKERLKLDADKIAEQYPQDTYPGHAAWLDWPWKLHRIHREKRDLKIELYNLAKDPQETTNLANQKPDRTKTMRADLEKWLASIVDSLNGKDY
jgi:arylsulfatase A-like enzyme